MGDWIKDPEWWSLAVSFVAFLASMAAVYMSTRSSNNLQVKQHQFETELRRQVALDTAKSVITKSVSRLHGILNSGVITAGGNASEEILADSGESILSEVPKLYAEIRDAYRAIDHHFRNQTRTEINEKIDEIESSFDAFRSHSIDAELLTGLLFKMSSVPELILQKISDEITASN